MAKIRKGWFVSPPRRKKVWQPRAALRVICIQKNGSSYYYVQMYWGKSGKETKLLGVFPLSSPTPLMDAALYAAHAPGRLGLDELYRLLHADKSFQVV